MNETFEELCSKLKAARFTGELHLRLEAGEVVSAQLQHYLEAVEFTSRELPTVEAQAEKEFALKP